MGAGVTFQLVYTLAAIARAWLWLRYLAARIFFAAFGAATTARCFPDWQLVTAATREGEQVQLRFCCLDRDTLRDHFYGLADGRDRSFIYTKTPLVLEVDDELARFMQPPTRRERGLVHKIEHVDSTYRILRDDTVITSGDRGHIYA